MRILLVTETYLPFISGVSTSSDSIARFMASRNHEVTVYAPKPVLPGVVPPADRLTVKTAPSVPDVYYRGKPITIFPLGFPGLQRLLRTGRFDVVHIQEPGSLGVSALIAAKLHGVPVVGALHFTPDQVARMLTGRSNALIRFVVERYISLIYNAYTAIMVPTQTFESFLHAIGVRRPVRVVSNGVNTDLYTPAPVRVRTVRKRGASVLYIGRIDKDKNVITLVSAMQFVKPAVHLIIAGNGKDKARLIALAKELGVGDRIKWKGSVTEREMIQLYRDADMFAIMAEYEIQSIVTLQALSCGLPVLLANAGALPELVRPGENGFLIEPHDVEGLAEKINYLADRPALRLRMGAKSRTMSLVHHKPTALSRLEALYEEVVHEAMSEKHAS